MRHETILLLSSREAVLAYLDDRVLPVKSSGELKTPIILGLTEIANNSLRYERVNIDTLESILLNSLDMLYLLEKRYCADRHKSLEAFAPHYVCADTLLTLSADVLNLKRDTPANEAYDVVFNVFLTITNIFRLEVLRRISDGDLHFSNVKKTSHPSESVKTQLQNNAAGKPNNAAGKPRVIIAIFGKMGSGKTTASEILSKELRASVIPFAKPIKDIAYKMGWDGEKDFKGRSLLQTLGTEVGRKYKDSMWIDLWHKEACEKGGIVIVDDLRFQNEYDFLRSLDTPVYFVSLTRGKQSLLSKVGLQASKVEIFGKTIPFISRLHASERGFKITGFASMVFIEGCLTVIDNSGTREQLVESLQPLIDKVKSL